MTTDAGPTHVVTSIAAAYRRLLNRRRVTEQVVDLHPSVSLSMTNWTQVLYALDCFAMEACGRDDVLSGSDALALGLVVRQQLTGQVNHEVE